MSTTPMFAPDGRIGDVPNDRVQDAVQAGFKAGVDMISPKGIRGTVPQERAQEALKAGFAYQSPANAIPKPTVNMQTMTAPAMNTPEQQQQADQQASDTRQMLVSGLTGMPTPNMSAQDRAQFEQGKAAGAMSVPAVAGTVSGGASVGPAIGSAATWAIPKIVKAGQWAENNKMQAYLLYQTLSNLVPGFQKAKKLIKDAPQ